jgi:hypothetical protein
MTTIMMTMMIMMMMMVNHRLITLVMQVLVSLDASPSCVGLHTDVLQRLADRANQLQAEKVMPRPLGMTKG